MSKQGRTTGKPQRVPLECGDVLWFRIAIPQYGEKLWCSKCHDYMTVGQPSHVTTLGFFPDYMWECVKAEGIFTGRCVHDPKCGHEETDRNWERLKKTMETHHLHAHSRSVLIFTTIERNGHVIDYAANATPPF